MLYPGGERDLDLAGERECDIERDWAGDRFEDLGFGDLLHSK